MTKVLINLLLVFNIASFAHAAIYPPAASYVVPQSFTRPNNISLIELLPSQGGARLIPMAALTSPLHQIAFFRDTSKQNLILVGIDKNYYQLFLLDQHSATLVKSPLQAAAIAEKDADHLIVADLFNELWTLDASGITKSLTPVSLIPRNTFGVITSLQMISPTVVVVLTPTHLLTVDIAVGRTKILSYLDLRRPFYGGKIFVKSFDLVASLTSAWISVVLTVPGVAAFWIERPVLVNLKTGGVTAMGPGVNSHGHVGHLSDMQLLDIDPTTQSLFMKRNDDYVLVDVAGNEIDINRNYFSIANIQAMGNSIPPLGNATVLVDQHRSALTWMPRAMSVPQIIGPPPSQALAPSPVVIPPPVQILPTPRQNAAVLSHPTQVAPLRQVKDYESADDFKELMIRELNIDLEKSMMVDEFVDRINTSELQLLRFYFQNLEAVELASFGIKLQMYSLRIVEGAEKKEVGPGQVAELLSKGRLREIQRKVNCEPKLRQ